LPLSDYNWDHLVQLDKPHKELEYVEAGETLSIKGIDVSRYQKTIDWQKAAADGVKYAILRVGYRGYDLGGLVKDELFDANATGRSAEQCRCGRIFRNAGDYGGGSHSGSRVCH
jgi:lysozyme